MDRTDNAPVSRHKANGWSPVPDPVLRARTHHAVWSVSALPPELRLDCVPPRAMMLVGQSEGRDGTLVKRINKDACHAKREHINEVSASGTLCEAYQSRNCMTSPARFVGMGYCTCLDGERSNNNNE
ncbi:hypothetical protein PV04_04594 [Phialophora macrospora]|uniref:Uncharacterized protein n=1 Tax=Phialophora macrospora TaxID=1851006 RepID=A0A0D2E2V2_9EURO|nr:hypothetical protein PV04_04594 [Phialophora macrospora]